MNVTIEECIRKCEEGITTIINDGKVIGFEKEESGNDTRIK